MSFVHSFKVRSTAALAALFVAALVMVSSAGVYAAEGDVPAAGAAMSAMPAETGMAGKATKEVENPYSIGKLWTQGDAVAKGTLTVLVIMSLATWYVLITKAISQTIMLSKFKTANKTFWKGSASEGIRTLDKKTPFYYLAADGLESVEEYTGPLAEKVDLVTWIQLKSNHAVSQVLADMQGGLAVLATVGSIAPFVGLFGTVWGIVHALTSIALAGQASIDKVAGPVGEALYMTAFGLFVAVPAVLAYNWLVRRNKVASEWVREFSQDLTKQLLGGRTVTSRAG